MSWQDLVLTIGNVLLAASLLPSIRSNDKPHVTTSLLAAGVLTSFAIAYVSLQFYMAAAMVSVSVVLWLVLAIQKLKR